MERLIYNINNFDYDQFFKNPDIQKRRKGNQGTRRTKRKYLNYFMAFDIEATNDPMINQAFMYIWQFQIEDITVVGRTWDEWILFLNQISEMLSEDIYLVIYVHNLSYEFSFLKGIYPFDKEEVFATDYREVLKCEMFSHFEFRCSYRLTNLSLKQFTKRMGVTEKLSGDKFDYSKQRYSWTKLSDYEIAYCITDVISLVQALKVYFKLEDDNFYTIPLTSTGFVRRDVKAAMRHFNKNKLNNMLPDYDLFCLLREAFRGGNTHSNRYYTDMLLDNVSSYDRVSSYPDVQLNELFPMGDWIYEGDVDIERACRKIYKQKRACIFRIVFWGIRLKDPMWGCPYIAKHKCRNLRRFDNDNGRILDADYLECTLTDIDFKIILNEYVFDDAKIFDFYHCRYGRLPLPMREVIQKYYQEKTLLKNVKGQELFYHKAKEKLNSIYGMSVQSPVKQSIDYIEDIFTEREEPEIELLEKSNKHAFLSYAWGVWTCARAREQLEIAIKKCGYDFVYCDTDSVKFIDNGNVDFTGYNRKRKNDSLKNGGFADDQEGKRYYLGLFDYEGTYKQFITLGAKKYAYTDQDDNLYITIAGVGKSKGAEEMKTINNFKEGFIFKAAGGTDALYNDDPVIKEIKKPEGIVKITSNVFIRQSSYTLGITGEYRKILNNPAIWLDLFK